VSAPRSITVFTRAHPTETSDAVRRLIELATDAAVEVRVPANEVEKHGLDSAGDANPRLVLGADPTGPTDLAVVLGGDGTILSTLRAFAGRDVPVFAFNYGAIGFLATVEHADLEGGVGRALAGDYEVLALPALTVEAGAGREFAVNDVSFHRRPANRVAELAYSVGGEELAEVRCDGLVVATAAGSTGYNLANGGPVMAWGVEGYVVSFIAPHALTARPLVVAPGDTLVVMNRSRFDDVEVTTDGRPVSALAPGEQLEVRFERDYAKLAQVPGATFYDRLRDKFGRLSY
jgi:NAD+ kinase